MTVARHIGQRYFHAHAADGECIAGLEIRFQIMTQAPTIVEYDRVGLAEIVDMKTIVSEEDRRMSPRNVGITQENVATWMAADGDGLHAIYSLKTSSVLSHPF